jgi:prepilin signal peptidase PulO-like enzyme (type II secretory pathway)
MELCVQVGGVPWRAGVGPRVLVVVLVLVVMSVATVRGYTLPDVLTIILGAGLAGSGIVRPLAALAVESAR